jgi:hypothetical protein
MIRLSFSCVARTRALWLLAIIGTLLISLGTGVRAEGEATPEQQERVETVVNRLLAVVKSRPTAYTWPPVVKVTTEAGRDNAYATLLGKDKDTGLGISALYVSPSVLTEIIKDNDDTLAFVLGHELSILRRRSPGSRSTMPTHQE